MSIQDKVALITGASRGIGFATAELFLSKGAKVIICGRHKEPLFQKEQVLLGKFPSADLLTVPCDIANSQDRLTLFEKIDQRFGQLDILINNAAIIHVSPFEDHSDEHLDEIYNVNIKGVFSCAQLAYRRMKATGGAIINISSLSGIKGVEKFPGFSSYVMSKFAVVGLTESLAVEGKPYQIRVNCVAPGAVDTQMLKEAAPQLRTQTQPDDIAQTIYFLADTSQSKRITGSTIEVLSNE